MEYNKDLTVSFLLNNKSIYEDCFDKDHNVVKQVFSLEDWDNVAIGFDDGQWLIIERDDFEWLDNHEKELSLCTEKIADFPKMKFLTDQLLDFLPLSILIKNDKGDSFAVYNNADFGSYAYTSVSDVGKYYVNYENDSMNDVCDKLNDGYHIVYADKTNYKVLIEDNCDLLNHLVSDEQITEANAKTIEKALKEYQNSSIKIWYKETYPDDELGDNLNDIPFDEVYNALNKGDEIYEFLGEDIDSIARERIFEELSNRKGLEYDDIYNLWITKDKKNNEFDVWVKNIDNDSDIDLIDKLENIRGDVISNDVADYISENEGLFNKVEEYVKNHVEEYQDFIEDESLKISNDMEMPFDYNIGLYNCDDLYADAIGDVLGVDVEVLPNMTYGDLKKATKISPKEYIDKGGSTTTKPEDLLKGEDKEK